MTVRNRRRLPAAGAVLCCLLLTVCAGQTPTATNWVKAGADDLLDGRLQVLRTERQEPQELARDARRLLSHPEQEAQRRGQEEQEREEREEGVVSQARDQDRDVVLPVLAPDVGEELAQRVDHSLGC